AARALGPGLADLAQQRAEADTGGSRLVAAVGRTDRAEHHALAVVAVARHGVELPELGLVLLERVHDVVEARQRDRGGALRRLGTRGALGTGLLRQRSAARRGRRRRAQRAAPEGGGVHGRPPQRLELVVEQHRGDRQAGHVQARDVLADLGLDEREALGLEAVRDAREDDELLLVRRRTEAV